MGRQFSTLKVRRIGCFGAADDKLEEPVEPVPVLANASGSGSTGRELASEAYRYAGGGASG